MAVLNLSFLSDLAVPQYLQSIQQNYLQADNFQSMGNGHHLFEQMISFKGPKEMLKIKWTSLLLPQEDITTSKTHWADSRGKIKTEVPQAEPCR